MKNDLPATPEGDLIRRVRDLKVPKLSIRAAAGRIGMSAEHWGYVERGYRYAAKGETPRQFRAPAATIAKMAASLGISPERLEREGHRPDAAALLRQEQPAGGRPAAAAPPRPRPALRATPEMQELIDRQIEVIRARIEVARSNHPGERLTGEMIFPASPRDAVSWDFIVSRGRADEEQIAEMIAILRARDEDAAAPAGRDGQAAGLTRAPAALP